MGLRSLLDVAQIPQSRRSLGYCQLRKSMLFMVPVYVLSLFMVLIISSTCRKLYVALNKKPIISSTCRKLYLALNKKP